MDSDDGLASLLEIEAGYSGNHHRHHTFASPRPLYYTGSLRRTGSLRSFSFSSLDASPRSRRVHDGRFEDHRPHFLEACFLCKKPLADNKDIFMYRGDTPFCSEECREEQIERDEAKEKKQSLSASMKALRKEQKRSKSTSPNRAQDHPLHTGTVAAA